jgi:IS5 family transposase
VIQEWKRNVYYQNFIGETHFKQNCPCAQSTLSRFKKRIGEEGANLILIETVALFGKRIFKEDLVCDSTVQEKYIAYQTDIRLVCQIIFRYWKIAKHLEIKLRNKFIKEVRTIRKDTGFAKGNNSAQIKIEGLNSLKNIAERLIHDLKSKMKPYQLNAPFFKMIWIYLIKY